MTNDTKNPSTTVVISEDQAKAVLERLEVAKRDISQAEDDLAIVLREMNAIPRAEKTTISDLLQRAFAKVSSARQDLINLETIITKKDE